MKRQIVSLVAFLLLATTSAGCGTVKAIGGRSTANLTAPGVAALHAKEVVKGLDVIRDTAVDGEAAHVVFSTTTTSEVVKWHKAALLTIRETPNGWRPIVLAGLVQLKKTLTPAEAQVLGPYIDAATLIIKAVI